jgi:hypothetical protein
MQFSIILQIDQAFKDWSLYWYIMYAGIYNVKDLLENILPACTPFMASQFYIAGFSVWYFCSGHN